MSIEKKLPSRRYLKQCFDYDPETGSLRWRNRPKSHFGSVGAWRRFAGHAGKEALTARNSTGNRIGCIDSRLVSKRRVIWKLIYGTDPQQVVHVNDDTDDFRLSNLREKKPAENQSGHRGVLVVQQKHGIVYRAKIGSRYLGYFPTLSKAVAARKAAEKECGYTELAKQPHAKHAGR